MYIQFLQVIMVRIESIEKSAHTLRCENASLLTYVLPPGVCRAVRLILWVVHHCKFTVYFYII